MNDYGQYFHPRFMMTVPEELLSHLFPMLEELERVRLLGMCNMLRQGSQLKSPVTKQLTQCLFISACQSL